MTIIDAVITPFGDYAFMRRALAACVMLAFSGTPLGVFMNLRQMSLVGDAMSHAILPGISVAFLFFGLSILPMTIAALATGLAVAVFAYALTRMTQLKEDAGFTLIYLVCLAFGVVMISRTGNGVDLLHILFGNILAIDNASLILATGVACATVTAVCLFYRGFVIDCFDPDFLRAATKGRGFAGQLFFVLVVFNLVASFQILGTLMALGLMLLPAIAARFWTNTIDKAIPLSVGIAIVSSVAGLLWSYHMSIPSGPAVVLVAGGVCVASVLCGRLGSFRVYLRRS